LHAKTEINAKILSLLYPTTPSGGVFKKKFKKILKYPATPSGGVFKILKKKWKSTPQVQVAGIMRTNFRHFLGYPATPSGGVPESRVFLQFFVKVGQF